MAVYGTPYQEWHRGPFLKMHNIEKVAAVMMKRFLDSDKVICIMVQRMQCQCNTFESQAIENSQEQVAMVARENDVGTAMALAGIQSRQN